MYRIFILSLLAIVSTTFALEPSSVILRATEIRGDSMVLTWSPLEGAKTYKVLYDEESLINPNAPEPILESPVVDKTTFEIQKMMEGTAYYIIVQGLDEKGVPVGKTLPLHASTLRTPPFTLREFQVINDQEVVLTFSRPVDLTKTQIEIANTETKKTRKIQLSLAEDDLRIVHIRLDGKMAPDVSHDLVLKKVTDTTGIEMPPEARKTSVIMFASVPATTESVTTEVMQETMVDKTEQNVPVVPETAELRIDTPKEPDAALDALEQRIDELGIERENVSIPLEIDEPEKTPVSIDKLPQTGSPLFLVICCAIALGGMLSYRKRTHI